MTEPATAEVATSFQFAGLQMRRLQFIELPAPEGGVIPTEPGQRRPVNLQFEVAAAVRAKTGDLHTTVTVIALPDVKVQPYRIEVALTGSFKAGEEVPESDLQQFARSAVPIILFPYIREAIYRSTMDGAYGPVLIDPINMSALVSTEGWKTVAPPSVETPADSSPAP